MRHGVLGVLAMAALLAAVPVALAVAPESGTPVAVHVSPATGSPRSTFTVSLKLPAQTGTEGELRRTDAMKVSGPHRSGCVSSAGMALPTAAAGTMVRMRLIPGRLGGHWCTGVFNGVITEQEEASCQPGEVCPLFVTAPRTIGRFHFRVRRSG